MVCFNSAFWGGFPCACHERFLLFMFRSRPIQYLGLALLLACSLLVIFFPVGSKPERQPYTLYLSAPKPLADLVDKKTTPVAAAEKALLEQFKTERLPGALTVALDDKKSATI